LTVDPIPKRLLASPHHIWCLQPRMSGRGHGDCRSGGPRRGCAGGGPCHRGRQPQRAACRSAHGGFRENTACWRACSRASLWAIPPTSSPTGCSPALSGLRWTL